MRVWYSIVGYNKNKRMGLSNDRLVYFFTEGTQVAQAAAENFWNCGCGPRLKWPITICLYESEDGPERARYTVKKVRVTAFEAKQCAKRAKPCVG